MSQANKSQIDFCSANPEFAAPRKKSPSEAKVKLTFASPHRNSREPAKTFCKLIERSCEPFGAGYVSQNFAEQKILGDQVSRLKSPAMGSDRVGQRVFLLALPSETGFPGNGLVVDPAFEDIRLRLRAYVPVQYVPSSTKNTR